MVEAFLIFLRIAGGIRFPFADDRKISMVILYLVLNVLLFTFPAWAEEASILNRADSLVIQAAILEIQAEAEEQRLARREKLAKNRDKLMTEILTNLAKGVAVVVLLLVVRAILGKIGRGVTEKRPVADPKTKTDHFILFVTTESEEEAARIGRCLVEERLAACANIVRDLRSVSPLRWRIRERGEMLMLIKTVRPRLEALTQRLFELHSAEVPEVISFPIHRGHKPYLEWIEENTDSQSWWKRIRRTKRT